MPDLNSILAAVGILIGIAVPSFIAYKVASGAAKKVDVETLENSYKKLQKTYEDVNARLNNELEAERLARRADRMSCESQIADLQRQLTALLSKLPEPGSVSRVLIAGIDTDELLALPVKLTGVQDDVILATEIKRPNQPWKMTIAEAAAVEAATNPKGGRGPEGE